MGFNILKILIMSLIVFTGWNSFSKDVAPKCNYCEGYAVLQKAMKKYPAPTVNEVAGKEHLKVVTLASKVIDQIFRESPKPDKKALEFFAKTLAKASLYDPGHELVATHWTKIKAHQKSIDQNLSSLNKRGELISQEVERLKLAVAITEGQASEGQD